MLLRKDGELVAAARRSACLTEADVRQAVRSGGTGALGDVAAVVLETDGSLGVIPRSELGDASALSDVERWCGGRAQGAPGNESGRRG